MVTWFLLGFSHVGNSVCMTDCSDQNSSTPERNHMFTKNYIVCIDNLDKIVHCDQGIKHAKYLYKLEYSRRSIPKCHSRTIQENVLRMHMVLLIPLTELTFFQNTHNNKCIQKHAVCLEKQTQNVCQLYIQFYVLLVI